MVTIALIALLGASSTVTFMGGSPGEFAMRITDETRANIIVVATSPFRPFRVQISDPMSYDGLKSASSYIANLHGLDSIAQPQTTTRSWCQTLRPKSLPLWFMPESSISGVPFYQSQYPQSSNAPETKDGSIVCKAEQGKYISVGSLDQLRLSKPLKVHWFLRPFRLSINGKFISEIDLLTAVADAIGGRLSDLSSSYFLDLDPKAYRTQLLATLTEQFAGLFDPFDKAYSQLSYACYQSISDSQISKMMASDSSYIEFNCSDQNELTQKSKALVEAFLAKDYDDSGQRISTFHSNMIQRADYGKPMVIFMSQRRGVKVRIPVSGSVKGYIEP